MRKALFPMLLLLAAACSDPAAPDDRWADPAQITYAPALGVDLAAMTRTITGLYLQDLTVGTGATAGVGDVVTVHYTGWLPDGTMFESTRDEPGEPPLQPFPLAEGLVIKGWDEGLLGMKVGGKRKLVIPPELAYGRGGRGRAVPPLATLIFDVELVRVDRPERGR